MSNATKPQMTLEQAYELLEGMPYRLHGVSGTIHITRVHGMTEVEHHPSPAGRRSDAYRAVKARLGDDYTTTITDDMDTLGELFGIAEKLYESTELPLVG